jgi:hypothetical protein
MNDREPGAFHPDCMKSDMHVWIKTFFKTWSPLMWLTLKVVLLPCSASVSEHNCSIKGWSHGTSRWRLKILCLTTTTGPPPEECGFLLISKSFFCWVLVKKKWKKTYFLINLDMLPCTTVTGESTSLHSHLFWCLPNMHTTDWPINLGHELTRSVVARFLVPKVLPDLTLILNNPRWPYFTCVTGTIVPLFLPPPRTPRFHPIFLLFTEKEDHLRKTDTTVSSCWSSNLRSEQGILWSDLTCQGHL